MSDFEAEGVPFFDVAHYRNKAAKEDEIFLEKEKPMIEDEMRVLLASVKTPLEAKRDIRQILLKHIKAGRTFTDTEITWKEEGGKVYITAEVKTSIVNSQDENSVLKIIATQVINIPQESVNHEKHQDGGQDELN